MTNPYEKNIFTALLAGAIIVLAAYSYGAQAANQNGNVVFNFTATPNWIAPGDSSTLHWMQPDSSTCDGTGFSTGGATSGSVTVSPNQSTTYSVTCDIGGTRSVTVTVSTQPPPSKPIVSLSANPTSLTQGASSLLSWSASDPSASGTTSCVLTDSWGSSYPVGALSGSQSVTPTRDTNYNLACTNNMGTSYANVSIAVTAPVFDASCSVNPTTAKVGQSVNWFASAWNGVAPYSYSWLGETIEGMTGSSINASYSSTGTKDGFVSVTDSSGYSGYKSATNDGSICTGPIIASDSDTEDGGSRADAQSWAKAFARSEYHNSAFGPADFHSNPQNYCVEAHLSQSCNPGGTQFGTGSCPFGVSADLHSGSGFRAAVSSDYSTANGWTTDKYWGAIIWNWVAASGQNVTRQCSTSVVVSANAPAASLTANPVSVTQGSSSTLTFSCTNATSASIDNGVGSVAAAGGTTSVTPTANTTYTLTCTGAGGTATAQATVSVTPPPPTGSCSVSPASVTTGQPATWTATPSGGNGTYTYSWTGTDGLSGTTSSVSPTYSAAGTKSASVTITSGGQSTPIVCTNTLNVTAAAQPDLTAGSVTPASATSGTPVTFTANAINNGNGPSGSFPVLFQIQNSAAQDVALIDSSYVAGLAAGASAPANISYTFTNNTASAMTYQVRACANYNTSWTAITTESNYGNNCGAYTTVTVPAGQQTPPPATPSLTCTFNNANPAVGGTVNYTTANGSGTYTWTPSDGVGSYGSASTASRTFSSAGQYGMQVSANGSTATCFGPGGEPYVTVGAATCASPSAKITANPMRVRKNDKSTLTWSATGVDTSCVISGPGGNLPVNPTSCLVSGSIQTLPITAQSVYTISCDNGESHDQVIVNLIPQFIEF